MDEVKATFRFVGDNVDPEYITHLVKLKPSSIRVKDAIVGKYPGKHHVTNYWGIDSRLHPDRPLVAHLGYLLDLIEPHSDAIRRLKREGYSPNFFCGLFHTSASGYIMLEPQVLKRITRLGAMIEIHTYAERATD